MVRLQNKQFPTVLVLTFLLFPVVAYRWTKRGDGDAGASWASGPGWFRWANWAHGASRRTGGKRDARGMYHSQQLSGKKKKKNYAFHYGILYILLYILFHTEIIATLKFVQQQRYMQAFQETRKQDVDYGACCTHS